MALVFYVSADNDIQDDANGRQVDISSALRTTSEFKYGTAGVDHVTGSGLYGFYDASSGVWDNGHNEVGDAVSGANFTIEGWFKFTAELVSSPGSIFTFGWGSSPGNTDFSYSVQQTSVNATTRSVWINSSSEGTDSLSTNITAGAWHHIAMVFNAANSTLSFMVDGVIVDGNFSTLGRPTAGDARTISVYVAGTRGYTDDFGISSTAKYTGSTGGTYAVPAALGGAAAAHMAADLTAPSPLIASSATNTAVVVTLSPPSPILICGSSARVQIVAPGPALTSYSGAALLPLTAPSPRLSAAAHDSYGKQAAFLTAPSPTLNITTGANGQAEPPTPTLDASGTVTIWGDASLTAPAPALTASVTVTEMASAELTFYKPYTLGAYSGAVVSVTLTGRASVQATGTTGSIGGAEIICPLFELTAVATMQNWGSADLLCPSPELGRTAQAWLIAPMGRLTAIGSAVITATYEAYAVNLKHTPRGNEQPIDEVTRYTNFPFTHVVRYKNSYYGVNDTGLYLLEGTTDETAPIPWAVKTAMDDFKSPMKKTVASAYFGGRFGPASTVQLHAGEQTPNTYSFTTPRDTLAQNYRQVFGKGVKERYYALGASGTGTVELDNVELETHNMTRRI